MCKEKKKFLYAFLVWLFNILLVIGSYFSYHVDSFVWLLFPAVMVSWLIMLRRLLAARQSGEIFFVSDFWGGRPKFFIGLTVASLLYFAVNFILCAYVLRDGHPEIVDGVYALVYDRGTFVRELSFAEYQTLRFAETRMAMGHLLIFSSLPMLFSSDAVKK